MPRALTEKKPRNLGVQWEVIYLDCGYLDKYFSYKEQFNEYSAQQV